MSQILSSIFQSMSIAVFLREDRDNFKLLTKKPSWLNTFCDRNFEAGQTVKLGMLFPFLECFMYEAEDVWESKVNTPHRSGPWIEFTQHGEELPLEATAICQDTHSLLVIQDLGEEYYNEVVRLQSFREKSLNQEELQLEIDNKTQEIRSREEEIAMKLLTAAGHRDHETAAHVRRIGLYAEVMARALKWDDAIAADIRIAAPMHDIGKIGIPDSVLLKPGKLTEEEFEVMKRHAEIGADMLRGTNIPLLKMASEIALCHHERWDGSGYPRGLKGKEIPESARITTIVDVYDALIHKRVYKDASSEQSALKMMEKMVGKHFDPDLFKVFIANLPKMQSIKESVSEPARIPGSLAP
ncbi:metal-dependent phosphohydrolase [Leucothrix pacifica]|uniref:Metal-dependent phosphohydrolase n=2 Tax=Leucothrix pacifica TaxID=1247513 RepID=A0A317CIF7_9GAMM|nr:metal-dependent phosphohydrolase [Leucothrix pacifica]